jgi:hypothetical protein
VQDVFKGRQGGTCVGGKLESGALRPGSKVLVVPGYVTASVKGLEVNSQVSLLCLVPSKQPILFDLDDMWHWVAFLTQYAALGFVSDPTT